MKRRACWSAVVLLLCAGTAHGQIPPEPDPSNARVRLGPLWLNPTVAVTDVGIDTNVFNDADEDEPKRDFTLTVSPQTDLSLRMGRTWLLGNIREDIVWYDKYESERSVNNSYRVNWLVPLTRLSFVVGGDWVFTRERPGFEIDLRSGRTERGADGAFEVRTLSRTLVGARGAVRKIEFDDVEYLGQNLRIQLNRTFTAGILTVRHELTPLTSFTADIGRQQERFEFTPFRDADSLQATIGLRFDTFAVLNGSAQFGFRAYTPLSSDLPSYAGSIAAVNLSYVALGSTRLGLQILRDVQHSFDFDQPYYLQTGVAATIGQQIYGPLDIEGRVGRQLMQYRDRAGAAVAVTDREDRVRSYGGGIGYRIGRDLRIAFNGDRRKRVSKVEGRTYDDLRYGVAVSFGR